MSTSLQFRRASAALEPGMVLKSIFGHGKSDIDFYVITRATTTHVWLQKIGRHEVELEGMAASQITPDVSVQVGSVFKRRTARSFLGHPMVRLDVHAVASAWDGSAIVALAGA